MTTAPTNEVSGKGCCETPMSDHVARFWKLLENETVHLSVNIRRVIGHDAPDGPTVYYDCSTFSDDVAKELVRLAATTSAQDMREALVNCRDVIVMTLETRGPDASGFLLTAVNKADRALSNLDAAAPAAGGYDAIHLHGETYWKDYASTPLQAPSHSDAVREWSTDFTSAPDGDHNYFLVRPQGVHPATGKLWLPTIVQREDGELYTTDNELEPLYFGQNEAADHPLKTTLEWKPLPADWTTALAPAAKAMP